MVAHTLNPSTQEAEAVRPAWSTAQVPGQAPRLHRETLAQKTNKQTNKKRKKEEEKNNKKQNNRKKEAKRQMQ